MLLKGKKAVSHVLLYFLVPYETLICDYRDPPWFNNKIKSLIYIKRKHLTSFAMIEVIVL